MLLPTKGFSVRVVLASGRNIACVGFCTLVSADFFLVIIVFINVSLLFSLHLIMCASHTLFVQYKLLITPSSSVKNRLLKQKRICNAVVSNYVSVILLRDLHAAWPARVMRLQARCGVLYRRRRQTTTDTSDRY